MSKLSERVRPDVEAAPWVVEEIKKLEAERDALAARVQEITKAVDDYVLNRVPFGAVIKALATPDTSAQILAQRDAAIWAEAAEVCKTVICDGSSNIDDCIELLRAKADELLKGLEKEQ